MLAHAWRVSEDFSTGRYWQLQVDQKGAEKTLDAETEQLKVGLHAVLMGSCCTVCKLFSQQRGLGRVKYVTNCSFATVSRFVLAPAAASNSVFSTPVTVG